MLTAPQPADSLDRAGEIRPGDSPGVAVWASIEQVGGGKFFEADQPQAVRRYRIALLYSAAVAALDATWSVHYRARRFAIEAVANPGERNREIELTCVELEA